jgi:rhodanese-related sulfurtransferase
VQETTREKESDVIRKTVLQLWAEANTQIELVSPQQLAEELETGEILLLDVRQPAEISRQGTIAGSVPVPRGVLEWWADPESPFFRLDSHFGDFDQRVVTFCIGGGNGAFCAVALQELGYRNVTTLEGGYAAWMREGLPTAGDSSTSR